MIATYSNTIFFFICYFVPILLHSTFFIPYTSSLSLPPSFLRFELSFNLFLPVFFKFECVGFFHLCLSPSLSVSSPLSSSPVITPGSPSVLFITLSSFAFTLCLLMVESLSDVHYCQQWSSSKSISLAVKWRLLHLQTQKWLLANFSGLFLWQRQADVHFCLCAPRQLKLRIQWTTSPWSYDWTSGSVLPTNFGLIKLFQEFTFPNPPKISPEIDILTGNIEATQHYLIKCFMCLCEWPGQSCFSLKTISLLVRLNDILAVYCRRPPSRCPPS